MFILTIICANGYRRASITRTRRYDITVGPSIAAAVYRFSASKGRRAEEQKSRKAEKQKSRKAEEQIKKEEGGGNCSFIISGHKYSRFLLLFIIYLMYRLVHKYMCQPPPLGSGVRLSG
jgi:hypothetical protein